MTRSRYPREGHRLAPATLRHVLRVPVSAKYLDRAGRAGMMLCDLDGSAWEILGAAACRELAKEVIRTVARALRGPLRIAKRRIPPIPRGMTLADLHLEVRTINCLVAAGIHERPQDLHALTIQDVLRLRGFWAKSLVDLLSSLEYVNEHREARRAVRTEAATTVKHLRAAHRYPRPGHRLAPQTLKEVLLDRLPGRLVRGTPFRGARLCDLDETAWDHLPPQAIDQLAGLIITRTALATHHPTITLRRLPHPPKGMRLEDLRLENRTHHCLERAGFADRPEELGQKSVGELLLLPAFGAKCLVDLLSSLETRVAREGKLDRKLTAAARALGNMPEAREIPFSDPRLGELLRAMDPESRTVGEMIERVLRRRLDPPDPLRLCEQLRELRQQIRQLTRLCLEEELAQIFAPSAGGRDRQIVAQYYGWDGRGGRTLEQLGKKYGLSRERIRQVCVRTIQRDGSQTVFAPVLDRALRFLGQRFPKTLDRLQAEFDASGISAVHLPVPAVQQAAQFLSRPVPFAVVDIGRGRVVVAAKFANIPPMIVRAARQVVTNYGAATVSQVVGELARRFRKKVGPQMVRETLPTVSDFRWLDAAQSWFRLQTLVQYGLPNMIDKILSVTGQIEVGKLRLAMARYRRSGRRLPPARILLEFCRQMPGVRTEGNTVLSDPPRDWRKILSGVERKMVQVLKKHGPVLERGTFEELCIRSGMNRFSFNAIVMCSPVITQFGRSVYGLLGAKVDRKNLKALFRPKPAAAVRVLRRFGRTKGGMAYLAYRLSKAVISGGVVTVPSAMKRQVRGKFTLRTPDGRKAGTLVAKNGCGWGLGPVLRRSNARQGDHLLLVFDTARREARIRIGGESILTQVARR
jgi:hypothetical protein